MGIIQPIGTSIFLYYSFSYFRNSISPMLLMPFIQARVSQGETFELGFFTPGNSRNYYIGIWYKVVPTPKTVVWVAKREIPVSDPFSSELKLLEDGNLVLLNETGNTIWSSKSAFNDRKSTSAKVLDDGNFVVRTNNSLGQPYLEVIWESFDFPTDHWLPGRKVGYNILRNETQNLVSWRSYENPAFSMFSLEPGKNESGGLLWNGSKRYWIAGNWTGEIFNLIPEIQSNKHVTNLTYISNENESYYTYASDIPNSLTRIKLDISGQIRQHVWKRDYGRWSLSWSAPTQQCEVYGFYGGFSICNQLKLPICICMEGFEPKVAKS